MTEKISDLAILNRTMNTWRGAIKARRQEALLKKGTLQSAIFNSPNFSSIVTDAKGIIQIFNVGAERMLGYTAANVMNKIILTGISDAQEVVTRAKALSAELGIPITPGFEALVVKASHGIEDIYELTYIRKDGSHFPAIVSVTVLRNDQDAIIGYLFIGTDNTSYKRTEQTLRESEKYFFLINDLIEATRMLINPLQIMAVMALMLGEHLRASRCAYADVEQNGEQFTILHDYTDGCASTVGSYQLSLFGARAVATLSNGQTLVIRDVEAEFLPGDGMEMFNAIGIKAMIACPLVKDGSLRALMIVHQTTPRAWKPDEITLVQDIVERCWTTIERKNAKKKVALEQARMRRLMDSNVQGVLFWNMEGSIFEANDEFLRIVNYTREDLEAGRLAWTTMTPAEYAYLDRYGLEEIAATGVCTPFEKEYIRKDGSRVPVLLGAAIFEDRPDEGICFVLDMTVRKEAEAAVRDSEQRLRNVIDGLGSNSFLGLMTPNGILIEANRSGLVAAGLRCEDVIGKSFDQTFWWSYSELAREQLRAAMARAAGGEPSRYDVQVRVAGDVLVWVDFSLNPVHDVDGRVTYIVLSGNIIHERVLAKEAVEAAKVQLDHLAHHDALTDLPNRMLFQDRLNQVIELACRQGRQVVVMFVDLDQFKYINDSLGHAVGDKLLQSVAQCLLGCVRHSDTISRQGGDEFVLLLPSITHPEDAAICAQKILAALALPHYIDQHYLHISGSIGISIYPDDGKDGETLIKSADIAMYFAKENGRNNYKFFKQDMNDRAVQWQSIEASLRRALERQEFVLHYQPKIDLKSGAIIGVEALIRWQHPERGQLTPNQFMAIAEGCGLILPMGRWVLREACLQAQSWQQAGLPPIIVAVNTSALEFRTKDFLDNIRAVLKETCLEPCYLELELTESVLMQDAGPTDAMLHTLADLGVRLSIDDFGTGYSSLSYLRQFPIGTLKVDQSLVNQMCNNSDDAAIVSAVISMGKSLKKRIIAEGIETQEQYEFLLAQDCDEGQGYYFNRPLAAKEITTLLQTGISLIAN